MFKIVSTEIKKMVSKPGVFVLAVLLAIILVLGVFIYEPKVYETQTPKFGDSIETIYANFIGNGTTSGVKVSSDDMVNDTVAQINSYKINNVSYKEYLSSLKENLKTNLKYYENNCYKPDYAYTDAEAIKDRNNVVNSLENLKNEVINAVKIAENHAYPVLTTTSNLDNFESYCKDGSDFIKKSVQREKIANACKDFTDNYMNQIFNCIDSFVYPSLAQNFITNYTSIAENSNLTKARNDLSKIFDDIQALNEISRQDENGTKPENIDKMRNLCEKYFNTASTYANLVKYELMANAFSYLSTKKQMSIMYLSSENEFNVNTNLIRYNYLFSHNSTENDFAHPLTIGVTSNAEKNGYDYAYFILKLFSFVIIAYAVMAACHAIAGEVKEGTMRYLAIRPVSRTKILFGKMLSIILMSTIFAIFSAVIAMIVGGVVYGLSSSTILTIFNGTTAITMHPIIMILIYIISMLIELTLYVSIALLLSCLLKSDLLAVTLMLMLYLLNVLIPAFVSNPTSWLAFYPFSHISIYSLFGSSVYATNNNFLNALLSAKVFTNTTLWLTLTVILVIGVVVNIASTRIFKRKEL